MVSDLRATWGLWFIWQFLGILTLSGTEDGAGQLPHAMTHGNHTRSQP